MKSTVLHAQTEPDTPIKNTPKNEKKKQKEAATPPPFLEENTDAIQKNTTHKKSPRPQSQLQKIVDIQILGAPSTVAQRGILDVLGLQKGDNFSKRALRNGVKRVFATGTWANIEIFANELDDGIGLQIVLTPDQIIADIQFEADREFPLDSLRKLLDVQSGDRLSERTLQQIKITVKHGLSDLGYPNAQVQITTTEESREAQNVHIRIQTGLPILVKSLVIHGSLGLSKKEIQDELLLWEGIPFNRASMETGLKIIKELLRRKRYLGAKAELTSLHFSANKSTVDVILEIEPGPAYSLRMSGNEVIADAYLKGILNITRIQGLSPQNIEAAKKKLLNYYYKNGFALAEISVADIRSTTEHERVLIFRIHEGPHSIVEEIIVEGAQKLSGEALAKDALAFVQSEGSSAGWFHRLDPGDVDDLLGTTQRKLNRPRAVEYSGFDLQTKSDSFEPNFALPYQEPLFVLVRDRLEDTYNAKGFLQAQVFGPEPLWLDQGRKVRVRFRVQEGPQTLVSNIRFLPKKLPLSLDELIATSRIVPGEPANLYAIEQTRLAIEKSLRRQGYPYARVIESMPRLGARKADVLFKIEAGKKIILGSVRIRGNNKTFEFVIKNHLALQKGVPYDSEVFEKARQRLLQSGLFSSVRIELAEHETKQSNQIKSNQKSDAIHDVIVQVRERKPLALEIGGGASINDGIRLFGTFGWRNILGLGMSLKTRWKVNNPWLTYGFVYADDNNSPVRFYDAKVRNQIPDALEALAEPLFFTEGQLVGSLEMPKVFFVPFPTRLHLDVVGGREIRQAFTLLRTSIIGGTESRPLPFWRVGAQLEGEISDFNCPRDLQSVTQGCGQGNLAITRRQDAGFVRQMTYRGFTSIDFRDDPIKPRSGVFASTTLELALGSGSLRGNSGAPEDVSVDFIKWHGVLRGYIPIGPFLTLDLNFKGGNIFPLSNPTYVPLYKRFYLGGTSTIRGYNEDEVLPIDDARYPATGEYATDGSTDLISFGGRFFLNTRSEARIDVGSGVELSIFLDAGQLFENVLAYSFQSLTLGSGIGIRYATPVGPLALHIGARILDGRRKLPQFTDLLAAYNFHISFGYF